MINRDILYFSIILYFYPSLFLLGICFFFPLLFGSSVYATLVFIVLTLPFCLSNGDIFVT